jgi:hypothetical protein
MGSTLDLKFVISRSAVQIRALAPRIGSLDYFACPKVFQKSFPILMPDTVIERLRLILLRYNQQMLPIDFLCFYGAFLLRHSKIRTRNPTKMNNTRYRYFVESFDRTHYFKTCIYSSRRHDMIASDEIIFDEWHYRNDTLRCLCAII